MTLQQRVERAARQVYDLHETDKLDKRVLAVGIEVQQKYLEYLDTLLDSDLHVENGVTIEVDGKAVHFKTTQDFEIWLAENLQ